MARINIEETLFVDPRFRALSRKIGNRQAIGTVVDLFRLAQLHWCRIDKETGLHSKSLIPFELYELEDFPQELIDFGMVVKKEGGFYVRGSEDHFAWLVQKREAGQKGGRPKHINNITKPEVNRDEPATNPLTLTPTLTPTLTLKKKNNTLAPDKPDAPKLEPLGKLFKENWKQRYGFEIPKWGVAQNSMLKKWVGEVGQEKAKEYIKLYLGWNDPWTIKAGHPVEIMVKQTNAFITDAAKGREKLKEIKTHQDFVKKEVEETAHERAERIYKNIEERSKLEAGDSFRKIQGPYTR